MTLFRKIAVKNFHEIHYENCHKIALKIEIARNFSRK